MVNMNQFAKRKTVTYSKGMIQRLGLAQALINEPDIIFLDEPSDGVDPIGRKEIREILLKLKEEGTTLFLNSHLLSEVEMTCDYVAIMDKGRILEEGSMNELTADANHYHIKCPQMKDEHLEDLRLMNISGTLKDNILDVTVDDIKQLNSVIDMIRSKGLIIEAVIPVKRTLETYFVNLIKDIREEGGNV